MTKMIRIENADTGVDYKVMVRVMERGGGTPPDNVAPDVIVRESVLSYPTALAEITIHSGNYVVISEAP